MKKFEEYIEALNSKTEWDAYLMQESGLPGPRGNIELAQAVALAGNEAVFLSLLRFTPDKAPVNTPEEFLFFCGTLGLGKLLEQGKTAHLETLRSIASDSRWRTREAVAMALQIYGEGQMDDLISEMEKWAAGNAYEMRAAAAALCEPKLLKNENHVSKVLKILDRITESIHHTPDRKNEGFIALKKGMAYCWSVAAVGHPVVGKEYIEKWADCTDKDIRWIIRENLKKKRLDKMDHQWTEIWKQKIGV